MYRQSVRRSPLFYGLFALLMIAALLLTPLSALAQEGTAADWPDAPAPRLAGADIPRPQRPIHNEIDAVEVKIVKATNRELVAQFNFPPPQMWEVQKGQEGFLQLAIPGMEQGYGPVGYPGIPFYSRLFAIPHGAQVTLEDVVVTKRVAVEAIIYPVQPEAVDSNQEGEPDDSVYADPPFVINREIYAGDAAYPAKSVLIEPVGQLRGLQLVRLSIATGRYLPATKTIEVVESVGLKLTFPGGEGFFQNRRDVLAFNRIEPALKALLLNHMVVDRFLDVGSFTPICWGTEFLIITDPAFRTAADRLAVWKRTAGISTLVIETGTDPADAGTTTSAIKDTIQDRYNDCLVQLSYVLLLGDAEHIPPWYNRTVPRSTGVDTPGSDLEYTLMSGGDILPDLALGRIPVDILTDADRVVDKIINYEQTPPVNADFYDTVTLASYFQCCQPLVDFPIPPFGTIPLAVNGVTSRSFIETSELIREELRAEGYKAKRIYTTNDNYHDDPSNVSTFYDASTRSTTPAYYNNLAPLPSFIDATSGFAWDGSTADIQDAINNGTFLLAHRDHGSISGWGSPSFKTADHSALTNGDLTPVVYSINCASGLFDNETRNPANDAMTYNTSSTGVDRAEDLLRREGGAVAIIGDTRNSPTWANSALERGLFDATWPGTVPEGGAASTNRLGDILTYGKLYLYGQIGVAQTAGSVSTQTAEDDILMYHLYGDPTLAMWTQNPNILILPWHGIPKRVEPRTWQIRYAVNGATITALQEGRPLGRGFVENGVATLRIISERQPGHTVTFVADHADAIPTTLAFAQKSGGVTPEQGGTVASPDGTNSAIFPAKAVTTTVEVIYTSLPDATESLPTGRRALQHFHLDAEDAAGNPVQTFSADYTLRVCPAQGVSFGDEETLAYFAEATGEWVEIDTDLEAETGCLVAHLDHMTEFAVLAPAAANHSVYLPTMQR